MLGDRGWKRNDAELRILEGPELSNEDLAFSNGWSNAQRSATDVTEAVLGGAIEEQRASRGPATIVLHTDSAVQTLADIVSGHDTWNRCRSRRCGSGSTAATPRSRP